MLFRSSQSDKSETSNLISAFFISTSEQGRYINSFSPFADKPTAAMLSFQLYKGNCLPLYTCSGSLAFLYKTPYGVTIELELLFITLIAKDLPSSSSSSFFATPCDYYLEIIHQ